jgi:Fe-Mn family superoxide dismutase
MNNSRRNFLKKSSLLAIAGIGFQSYSSRLAEAAVAGKSVSTGLFSLPELPYKYDALEPHIDKLTMEIHHTKHHKAYVDNLNKALGENKESASIEEILKTISGRTAAVRNNGGGHWNHSFFWKLMSPNFGGMPTGKIENAINAAFDSIENFKTKFEETGLKRFGSGWAWLILNKDKKLEICSTPNQDNPLMGVSEIKGIPVLGVDVWEHAYYLKYQNKRGDYLKSWWNVVNWEEVNRNLEEAERK